MMYELKCIRSGESQSLFANSMAELLRCKVLMEKSGYICVGIEPLLSADPFKLPKVKSNFFSRLFR